MKESEFLTITGFLMIVIISTIITHKMGVINTYKEAFDRGLMIKEVTKDDRVIYKWKDSK